MTRLPNLELLMYKAGIYLDYDEEFVQKAKGKSLHFTIETFPQTWGSTCTGFDTTEDGKATVSGCAMTTEYTSGKQKLFWFSLGIDLAMRFTIQQWNFTRT